ncbi:MAG: hypothetical protein V2A54_12750 [Bacteroidota bacterium]
MSILPKNWKNSNSELQLRESRKNLKISSVFQKLQEKLPEQIAFELKKPENSRYFPHFRSLPDDVLEKVAELFCRLVSRSFLTHDETPFSQVNGYYLARLREKGVNPDEAIDFCSFVMGEINRYLVDQFVPGKALKTIRVFMSEMLLKSRLEGALQEVIPEKNKFNTFLNKGDFFTAMAILEIDEFDAAETRERNKPILEVTKVSNYYTYKTNLANLPKIFSN